MHTHTHTHTRMHTHTHVIAEAESTWKWKFTVPPHHCSGAGDPTVMGDWEPGDGGSVETEALFMFSLVFPNDSLLPS